MSFYNELKHLSWEEAGKQIYQSTEADVANAFAHAGEASLQDFMALISPAADRYLEEMAQESHKLTLKRFGNTMQMYVPLYLSNACTNGCVYCGFNHGNKITRKTLTLEEVAKEATAIKKMGFEHLLLLTGEHPKEAGYAYLKETMHYLKTQFAHLSIEVQPMETDEYSGLIPEGLNTVYIYQETYNEAKYPDYHPRGKKANYQYRLETPDRIGAAEVHKIGLGALLGLEDWRVESFFTAMHIRYLQKHYWQTRYSVAFPRLRPHAGSFQPNHPVNDRQLVQLITAWRMFDENIELSLTTRESAIFRDHACKLGITSMSAGSKTEPGGYAEANTELPQFDINDARSPETIAKKLQSMGYEPVWKDWDPILQ